MSILKFDNVSKVFYSKTQQTVAVDRLSFCVDEGQFVAIIGPSGCGKTTILSLVCGLIEPTSGKVLFEKNDSRVGYMLQRDQLFEWRTIEKNVLLGLEIRGKVRDEDKEFARELLKKYGLWEFRKHYPQELSGGMRQRAALIRTLATRPDLLLLDEPFSALDFQTRLSVCDDVYGIIREEHKTALLVTHDISEAISMADTVIVLTARPAKVLTIHKTNLENIETPLKRRESPEFSKQFELLHKYLSGASQDADDCKNCATTVCANDADEAGKTKETRI
ncbi:MAG: ABC transporter ATP-binding protein [Corallococcus sp.]|nr:ABC transporter ATP-binding protein [Corallococcus sp.]MCM1359108.1 ABC transporter ATP-binding protein [Corallococcus sp.]MCM1394498.1 ABC transporter ATP-binding protein [Corallococcus sp.]